ncbi:MAG: ABC transporter substrate-binding protein [Ruminococcus sp.]|nr:ABC transporter substrate-binding protein [Ruminococcus sp.]
MKNKLAFTVAITILFSGCSNSDSTSSSNSSSVITTDTSSETTLEQDLTYFTSFDEKLEEYKKTYEGSTVLVWLTEWTPTYEQAYNDYLYENGYDYVVCFKNIIDYEEDNKSYYQITNEMIDNGEQIDIIDSFGVIFGQEAISNNYYYYSENGLFEPLDSYLSDEKYSEYYNLMPQEYWDSYKYNGSIYGIDNSYSSLYSDNGFAVNNEIFEETDYTIESFLKPLNELQEELKDCYDATGMFVNISRFFFTSDFYIANYIDEGIAIKNSKAVNVFEQEKALDYYKLINEMRMDGYATIDSSFEDMTAIECISSPCAYGETIENEKDGLTKVFYQQNNYIKNPTRAIGISTKSKNKSLSFDCLMDITFNSKTNNVITYGIEGVNHNINSDGTVEMISTDETTYQPDLIYNNCYVSAPCTTTNNEIYAHDYPSAYENAQYLDGFGFLFDASEIKDTYLSVVNKISEFNPTSDDIDSYLVEFNQELYDAGMQDVLDEINRQYEEWSENEK